MKPQLLAFLALLFGTLFSHAQITETFSNVSGGSSYTTINWTGDAGGSWSATDARADQTINGPAILVRNGVLTSPQVSGGIGDLTVTTQREFSGGSGNMDVRVNGVLVGTVAYDGTVQTVFINGINISGTVQVEIDATNSASDRVKIDDLTWTAFAGTLAPEPANHVTNFAASTTGISSITLGWNDPDTSNGANPATGLLLIGEKDGASAALPQDSNAVNDDLDWSDNLVSVNVAPTYDTNNYTFSNIIPNSSYVFRLYPYSNAGNTIDYKLDAPIPTVSINAQTVSSCDSSYNFTIDSVSATEAYLSWTNGSGNLRILEYGVAGFSLGSGQTVSTSDSIITLTGLTDSTTYEVYLTDSCLGFGLSAAQGPFTFTTDTLPAVQGDLIISEYGEGSSNNKWLELYNGTGATIDLSLYALELYANNNTSPNATENLSGNLANGSTYVLANSGAVSAVTALADISSGVCNFNGNDAIILTKNGQPLDVFGIPGQGINYDIAGQTGASQDQTLVRKQSVCAPNSNWAASAGTNAVDSEWEIYPQDDFGFIGQHTQNCNVAPPTCDDPTNLNVDSLTNSTAILNWNSGTTTTQSLIEYGVSGFGLGQGAQQTTTDTSLSISGLQQATTYEFYVQDSCLGIGKTAWIGPVSFTTASLTCQAPVLDSVGNITFNSAEVYFTGVASSYEIEFGLQGFTQGSGTVLNATASPISLTALQIQTTYELYLTAFCAGIGQSATVGPLSFTTASATCSVPSAVSVDSVSASAASFSFSISGTGITQIEYGLAGFTLGSGTQLDSISSPFLLSGLADSTSYEFYLRDSCAGIGTSSWVGPFGFVTDTLPTIIGDLIISEYGEGSSNNKWLELYNGTGATIDLSLYALELYANNNTSPNATENLSGNLANGSTYVLANSGAVSTVTALADISSGVCNFNGNDAIILTKNGQPLDVFGIPGQGSNYNIAGQTGASQDQTLVRKQSVCAPNSNWTASAGTSTFDSEWEIYPQDDFSFIGQHTQNCNVAPPTCNAPSQFDTTIVQTSSIGLSWTTGGSSLWNIEYGPSGFVQGSGTVITVSTNPFTLAGLSPGTTYEIYVQDTCTGLGTSPWTGPLSVTTDTLPPSCVPPSSVIVDSITTTSAEVRWTGASVPVIIEYGLQGFTPGQGTRLIGAFNPTVLNGLQDATAYDVYVSDSCLGVGVSASFGPVSFTTDSVTPAGPDLIITGVLDGTLSGGTPKVVELYATANGNFANYELRRYSNGGTSPSTLPIPAQNFTANTFYYLTPDTAAFSSIFGNTGNFSNVLYSNGFFSNGDDVYELIEVGGGSTIDLHGEIGVDGTGEYWEYLDSYGYRIDGFGPNPSMTQAEWIHGGVDLLDGLSAAAIANTVPFGTYNQSSSTLCNDPSALAITNVTGEEAQLSWTSGGAPLTNIEFGPLGFTLGTGVRLTTPNNPFTLTSLSPLTTYEVYIQDSCPGTGSSNWVGPVDFTTAAATVISTYTINQVRGVDADGVLDSLGVVCRLRGVVTSIDFDGNSGYSFYIQDNTHGINVYAQNDLSSGYQAQLGQEIRVMGEIGQFNGLAEIFPDSIVVESMSSTLPSPQLVTSLNENTEGRLIQLDSVSVLDPTQWPASGGSANVALLTPTGDTLVMRIDSDTDVDDQLTAAPANPFTLRGIGGQFDSSIPYTSGYQIFPRFVADFDTTFTPPLYKPNLLINEVSTDNSSYTDGNGEADDWIEIYNPTGMAINLGGLYISNNALTYNRFRFPENEPTLVVPAEGFLILWADNQITQGANHLNFSLSRSGDEVFLSATDLSRIDSVIIPSLANNESYGRLSDGGMPWVVFSDFTPRATNANGIVQSIYSDQNGNDRLKVYPNPVSGTWVHFSKPISGRVYNLLGEQVEVFEQRQKLSVNQWPRGLYFIETKAGERVKFLVN